MPQGFYITSPGLTRLIQRLKKLGPEMEKLVEAEIADTALRIERRAAQWAPKDMGFLHNSIKAERYAALQWQVSAQVRYAAFVEFGTGGLVDIPAGLEEYARKFMAPRPVKREVNLPARPFFFPAYRAESAELDKRLKTILAEELKKAK
jgi:HK97 gp10 family phage protein